MILLVTMDQKIQFGPYCIKLLWCECCWIFVKKKTIWGTSHQLCAVTRCWLVFDVVDDLFSRRRGFNPHFCHITWDELQSVVLCVVMHCDGCSVLCFYLLCFALFIMLCFVPFFYCILLSVALIPICVTSPRVSWAQIPVFGLLLPLPFEHNTRHSQYSILQIIYYYSILNSTLILYKSNNTI